MWYGRMSQSFWGSFGGNAVVGKTVTVFSAEWRKYFYFFGGLFCQVIIKIYSPLLFTFCTIHYLLYHTAMMLPFIVLIIIYPNQQNFPCVAF